MIDLFKTHARSLTSPPEFGATIEPDDSGALSHVTRAIYVGGAGSLTVQLSGGDQVTLAAVPAGSLLPLRAARILATGTTATDIVGLW